MGLVHFCCMGLSSSAAQHSSSVPERNQRLEDAQAEDTQSNEQRDCVTGRGEGAACTHSKGNLLPPSSLPR